MRPILGSTLTVALAAFAIGCGADAEESAAGRGAGAYRANCSACHGADLDGSGRGPSLLLDVYGPDQLSDAEMAAAIRNGVDEERWDFGPMPGNGGLSDLQVEEIIAFVRAGQRDAATP